MKFSVFQVSRRGGREKNEDRMGYCYTRESGLFVLADGMGGHPEGEVAAQMALQTVSALFQKEAKPSVEGCAGASCQHQLMAAHHQIIRYASDKGMMDTPRTTLVAAVVQGAAHLGPLRRLAPVRGARPALLTRTRDHSYMEHQRNVPVRMDRINRNMLFTCLGSPTKPVYDMTGPVTAAAGRQDLLCSDGLWGTAQR
jgi:serine/threonine protein phosphatase PrpC